ncbi:hypothetical protein OCOJLMKI_2372 [Methylobacterium iners]|uniref:Uncharacterized protein n=1 Tax=Methylobacterium iners TaxID=418707 RepID=A0ABQ4RYX8_9HYPH|nr:hypothetical protein OCOJLMKI_2372 [Methylobacterium iners]
MDLVVHATSGARVRGSLRVWHFQKRPLTLGCRLALPTTRSAKPSPREQGEGMRTTVETGRNRRKRHLSSVQPQASRAWWRWAGTGASAVIAGFFG